MENHRKMKMKMKTKISQFERMVTIDEEERESLRKLAEVDDQVPKNKKQQLLETKMVTIDEEEREILRKLAQDDHRTTPGDVKTTPARHPSRNNKVDELPRNNNGKLETKKSEDINESAEKFIQNFRQQLFIQRLESIENYDQMLARGL